MFLFTSIDLPFDTPKAYASPDEKLAPPLLSGGQSKGGKGRKAIEKMEEELGGESTAPSAEQPTSAKASSADYQKASDLLRQLEINMSHLRGGTIPVTIIEVKGVKNPVVSIPAAIQPIPLTQIQPVGVSAVEMIDTAKRFLVYYQHLPITSRMPLEEQIIKVTSMPIGSVDSLVIQDFNRALADFKEEVITYQAAIAKLDTAITRAQDLVLSIPVDIFPISTRRLLATVESIRTLQLIKPQPIETIGAQTAIVQAQIDTFRLRTDLEKTIYTAKDLLSKVPQAAAILNIEIQKATTSLQTAETSQQLISATTSLEVLGINTARAISKRALSVTGQRELPATPTTPAPSGAMPWLKAIFIRLKIAKNEEDYNLRFAWWVENVISFIGGLVLSTILSSIVAGTFTINLNAAYLFTWPLFVAGHFITEEGKLRSPPGDTLRATLIIAIINTLLIFQPIFLPLLPTIINIPILFAVSMIVHLGVNLLEEWMGRREASRVFQVFDFHQLQNVVKDGFKAGVGVAIINSICLLVVILAAIISQESSQLWRPLIQTILLEGIITMVFGPITNILCVFTHEIFHLLGAVVSKTPGARSRLKWYLLHPLQMFSDRRGELGVATGLNSSRTPIQEFVTLAMGVFFNLLLSLVGLAVLIGMLYLLTESEPKVILDLSINRVILTLGRLVSLLLLLQGGGVFTDYLLETMGGIEEDSKSDLRKITKLWIQTRLWNRIGKFKQNGKNRGQYTDIIKAVLDLDDNRYAAELYLFADIPGIGLKIISHAPWWILFDSSDQLDRNLIGLSFYKVDGRPLIDVLSELAKHDPRWKIHFERWGLTLVDGKRDGSISKPQPLSLWQSVGKLAKEWFGKFWNWIRTSFIRGDEKLHFTYKPSKPTSFKIWLVSATLLVLGAYVGYYFIPGIGGAVLGIGGVLAIGVLVNFILRLRERTGKWGVPRVLGVVDITILNLFAWFTIWQAFLTGDTGLYRIGILVSVLAVLVAFIPKVANLMSQSIQKEKNPLPLSYVDYWWFGVVLGVIMIFIIGEPVQSLGLEGLINHYQPIYGWLADYGSALFGAISTFVLIEGLLNFILNKKWIKILRWPMIFISMSMLLWLYGWLEFTYYGNGDILDMVAEIGGTLVALIGFLIMVYNLSRTRSLTLFIAPSAESIALPAPTQVGGVKGETELPISPAKPRDGLCVTGDTLLPIVKVHSPYRMQSLRGVMLWDPEVIQNKSLHSGQSIVHSQGTELNLKPIVEVKPGDYVLSLNEETQAIEPHRINALLDMGIKPVYRLTTASGRSIKTTANHPYLVRVHSQQSTVHSQKTKEERVEDKRWIRVRELKVGYEIGVPRSEKLSTINLSAMTNLGNEYFTLGEFKDYTIIINAKTVVSTPSSNQRFSEMQRFRGIKEIIYLFYNLALNIERKFMQLLLCIRAKLIRSHKPNRFFTAEIDTRPEARDLSKDLEKAGLNDSISSINVSNSSTKVLGSAQFKGSAILRKSSNFFRSSSGSSGLFKPALNASGFQLMPNFLSWTASNATSSFSNSSRGSAARIILDKDIYGVPISIFVICPPLISLIIFNLSQKRRMSRQFIHGASYFIPEAEAEQIVDVPANPDPIRKHSTSNEVSILWDKMTPLGVILRSDSDEESHIQGDMKWDPIVSIEYAGYEHVYDIEVEGTHNFIGNGIFAHNTAIGKTTPTPQATATTRAQTSGRFLSEVPPSTTNLDGWLSAKAGKLIAWLRKRVEKEEVSRISQVGAVPGDEAATLTTEMHPSSVTSRLRKIIGRIFMTPDKRDAQRIIHLLSKHYKGKIAGLNHFEGTVRFYDKYAEDKVVELRTRVFCSNNRTLSPISPINTEGDVYQRFFENHWFIGVEDIPKYEPTGYDYYTATYHEILTHYKKHPDIPITLIHAHGIVKGNIHYIATDSGMRKTVEVITELIKPYANMHLGYKPIVILASCNAVDETGKNPISISHPYVFLVYTYGLGGPFGTGDLRITKENGTSSISPTLKTLTNTMSDYKKLRDLITSVPDNRQLPGKIKVISLDAIFYEGTDVAVFDLVSAVRETRRIGNRVVLVAFNSELTEDFIKVRLGNAGVPDDLFDEIVVIKDLEGYLKQNEGNISFLLSETEEDIAEKLPKDKVAILNKADLAKGEVASILKGLAYLIAQDIPTRKDEILDLTGRKNYIEPYMNFEAARAIREKL